MHYMNRRTIHFETKTPTKTMATVDVLISFMMSENKCSNEEISWNSMRLWAVIIDLISVKERSGRTAHKSSKTRVNNQVSLVNVRFLGPQPTQQIFPRISETWLSMHTDPSIACVHPMVI